MNWLAGTLSYRLSEAMICNFLSSKGRLTLTPPRRCDSRNAIAISNACRPSSPVHFGGRPVSMALTISSTIVNPMPCILTGHGNGHLAGTPPPRRPPGMVRISSNSSALLRDRIRPVVQLHPPPMTRHHRTCYEDTHEHRY